MPLIGPIAGDVAAFEAYLDAAARLMVAPEIFRNLLRERVFIVPRLSANPTTLDEDHAHCGHLLASTRNRGRTGVTAMGSGESGRNGIRQLAWNRELYYCSSAT